VQPALPVEAPPAIDLGEDTIERVLGSLEPVDHSTSFAHEPTERLPMLRAEPPRTATAGKRRASKGVPRRGSLVRGMPSAPVLVGIAALAISIGGTIGVSNATSATTTHVSFRPPSALSGTSSVGHAGGRAAVVSRGGGNRQDAAGAGTGDSSSSTGLSAAANGMVEQRTEALQTVNAKAETQAQKIKSNLWGLPVVRGVYHLTARFGQYGLWSSFHTGLDFAAPTGTPIHAIASGVIIFTAYDGAYGNKTIERLSDGTELWYCHQNEFGTSVGDVVTEGEVIGYVGSTGHTTGPHVHIEVHPGGGDPVDPFPAFQQHGITP
jgi:hypothetical protein